MQSVSLLSNFQAHLKKILWQIFYFFFSEEKNLYILFGIFVF